jgi:hypothetical protein
MPPGSSLRNLEFLAVGVEVIDQMSNDFDFAAIDVELARLYGRILDEQGRRVELLVR